MRRWRERPCASAQGLRIAPSKLPALSPKSELIVELFNERGGLVRRFDFGAVGAPPMMARELALAFRGHLADKSAPVWAATFGSGIRHWLRFLAEREGWAERIESLREVDRTLLCEFIAWLDHRGRIGLELATRAGRRS